MHLFDNLDIKPHQFELQQINSRWPSVIVMHFTHCKHIHIVYILFYFLKIGLMCITCFYIRRVRFQCFIIGSSWPWIPVSQYMFSQPRMASQWIVIINTSDQISWPFSIWELPMLFYNICFCWTPQSIKDVCRFSLEPVGMGDLHMLAVSAGCKNVKRTITKEKRKIICSMCNQLEKNKQNETEEKSFSDCDTE